MTANLTPPAAGKRRTESGLTQTAAATSAGISHASAISNFENGRLVLADWQAARLIEALGMLERDGARTPVQLQEAPDV
jgi:DNA-binding XRE family transcriptional regulator